MVDAIAAIETVRAELERAQREIERLTAERRAAVAQYEEELNMGRVRDQKLAELQAEYDARAEDVQQCEAYHRRAVDVERERDAHLSARDAYRKAAETLQAERDSARAENKRLRDALHNRVVTYWVNRWRCDLCGSTWTATQDEHHAPGCLAAPEGDRT